MVEKDAVSKDFSKQGLRLRTDNSGKSFIAVRIVPGCFKLTSGRTDMFPNFPALKDFLAIWEKSPEGALFAVTVAHSEIIKPAELRAIDGVFRLH